MENDDANDTDESFAELRKIIPNLSDVEADPEQAVRDIHFAWKEAGGVVAGKPRHSDRFLDDRLKAKKTPVRSLTPKIVGKTRIKADDAETLVRYFLSNWPQAADGDLPDSKKIRYSLLVSTSEIDEIVRHISTHIDGLAEAQSVSNSLPSISKGEDQRTIPGQDVGELIPELFAQSDALFTVATETAIVAQSKETVLIGFRNLINDLHSVEEEDEIERPLIWVLDMGRRVFEDLEARLRYAGFKNLQMRFDALKEFEDRGRAQRWEWLLSRSVFVIQDTLYDEPFDMKGVKRPLFLAHHVSFTAIAPSWASSPNFRTLYGRDLEDVDERSFSVFFNAKGWSKDEEFVTQEVQHCRYFGYAPFAKDQKPGSEKLPRGLELPFMGYNFEDAYRTVYAAATELLNLENRLGDASVNGKHAIAQLRYLGFRLMRLEDFMKL